MYMYRSVFNLTTKSDNEINYPTFISTPISSSQRQNGLNVAENFHSSGILVQPLLTVRKERLLNTKPVEEKFLDTHVIIHICTVHTHEFSCTGALDDMHTLTSQQHTQQ